MFCLDKKKQFYRSINLILIFSFFISMIPPEARSQSVVQNINPASEISDTTLQVNQETTSLEIPSELGSIRDSFLPIENKNSKIVYLLQDAHCNYEAQKNLGALVGFLNREKGTKLIGVEGAKGRIVTTPLSKLSDKEHRNNICREYIKKGLLTGLEGKKICEGDELPVDILGLENREIYLENLQSFRFVIKYLPESERYIKELESVVRQLSRKIYSKEQLELREAYYAFKEKKKKRKDFLIYLKELLIGSMIGKVVSQKYSAFHNMTEIALKESQIDFQQLQVEQDKFWDEISNIESDKKASYLLKKEQFENKEISSKEYFTLLKEIFLKEVFLKEKYPQLLSYIELKEDFYKIKTQRFLGDVDEVVYQLLIEIADNEKQKDFILIDRLAFIQKRILKLSLTRAQLTFIENHRYDFVPLAFFSKLKKIMEKERIPVRRSFLEREYLIQSNLESALEYYRALLLRDQIMLSNLIRAMNEQGESQAMMLVGGFHTDGITDLLKAMRIPHYVISPRVGKPTDLYFKVMMGEDLRLDDALYGNALARALLLDTGLGITDSKVLVDFIRKMGKLTNGDKIAFEILKKLDFSRIGSDTYSEEVLGRKGLTKSSYLELKLKELYLEFSLYDPPMTALVSKIMREKGLKAPKENLYTGGGVLASGLLSGNKIFFLESENEALNFKQESTITSLATSENQPHLDDHKRVVLDLIKGNLERLGLGDSSIHYFEQIFSKTMLFEDLQGTENSPLTTSMIVRDDELKSYLAFDRNILNELQKDQKEIQAFLFRKAILSYPGFKRESELEKILKSEFNNSRSLRKKISQLKSPKKLQTKRKLKQIRIISQKLREIEGQLEILSGDSEETEAKRKQLKFQADLLIRERKPFFSSLSGKERKELSELERSIPVAFTTKVFANEISQIRTSENALNSVLAAYDATKVNINLVGNHYHLHLERGEVTLDINVPGDGACMYHAIAWGQLFKQLEDPGYEQPADYIDWVKNQIQANESLVEARVDAYKEALSQYYNRKITEERGDGYNGDSPITKRILESIRYLAQENPNYGIGQRDFRRLFKRFVNGLSEAERGVLNDVDGFWQYYQTASEPEKLKYKNLIDAYVRATRDERGMWGTNLEAQTLNEVFNGGGDELQLLPLANFTRDQINFSFLVNPNADSLKKLNVDAIIRGDLPTEFLSGEAKSDRQRSSAFKNGIKNIQKYLHYKVKEFSLVQPIKRLITPSAHEERLKHNLEQHTELEKISTTALDVDELEAITPKMEGLFHGRYGVFSKHSQFFRKLILNGDSAIIDRINVLQEQVTSSEENKLNGILASQKVQAKALKNLLEMAPHENFKAFFKAFIAQNEWDEANAAIDRLNVPEMAQALTIIIKRLENKVLSSDENSFLESKELTVLSSPLKADVFSDQEDQVESNLAKALKNFTDANPSSEIYAQFYLTALQEQFKKLGEADEDYQKALTIAIFDNSSETPAINKIYTDAKSLLDLVRRHEKQKQYTSKEYTPVIEKEKELRLTLIANIYEKLPEDGDGERDYTKLVTLLKTEREREDDLEKTAEENGTPYKRNRPIEDAIQDVLTEKLQTIRDELRSKANRETGESDLKKFETPQKIGEALVLINAAIALGLGYPALTEEQMMAALGAFQGQKVLELATGEGKTEVSLAVGFLNSLFNSSKNPKLGGGSLIITTKGNSAIDTYERGIYPYSLLGMKIGVVKDADAGGDNVSDKRKAYRADVTVVSTGQFHFDVQEDLLMNPQIQRAEDKFIPYDLKDLAVVIDEFDSVMIHQAQTEYIRSSNSTIGEEKISVENNTGKRIIRTFEGLDLTIEKEGSEEREQIFSDEIQKNLRAGMYSRRQMKYILAYFIFKKEKLDGQKGTEFFTNSENRKTLINEYKKLLSAEREKIGIEGSIFKSKIEDTKSLVKVFENDEEIEKFLLGQIEIFQQYTKGVNYDLSLEDQVQLIDYGTGSYQASVRLQSKLGGGAGHVALELLEKVGIGNDSTTQASLSARDVLLTLGKAAGITGTAFQTHAGTSRLYGLEYKAFTPHNPIIRRDIGLHGLTLENISETKHDLGGKKLPVFKKNTERLEYLAQSVIKDVELGRPVLIFADSITEAYQIRKQLFDRLKVLINDEESDVIRNKFKRMGRLKELPDGKFEPIIDTYTAAEAESKETEDRIVDHDAGQMGAITVVTNIGSRGTDFKLSDGAKELGYHTYGIGPAKGADIELQRRGRSGRQGAMGITEELISLEGDIDFIREVFKATSEEAVQLKKLFPDIFAKLNNEVALTEGDEANLWRMVQEAQKNYIKNMEDNLTNQVALGEFKFQEQVKFAAFQRKLYMALEKTVFDERPVPSKLKKSISKIVDSHYNKETLSYNVEALQKELKEKFGFTKEINESEAPSAIKRDLGRLYATELSKKQWDDAVSRVEGRWFEAITEYQRSHLGAISIDELTTDPKYDLQGQLYNYVRKELQSDSKFDQFISDYQKQLAFQRKTKSRDYSKKIENFEAIATQLQELREDTFNPSLALESRDKNWTIQAKKRAEKIREVMAKIRFAREEFSSLKQSDKIRYFDVIHTKEDEVVGTFSGLYDSIRREVDREESPFNPSLALESRDERWNEIALARAKAIRIAIARFRVAKTEYESLRGDKQTPFRDIFRKDSVATEEYEKLKYLQDQFALLPEAIKNQAPALELIKKEDGLLFREVGAEPLKANELQEALKLPALKYLQEQFDLLPEEIRNQAPEVMIKKSTGGLGNKVRVSEGLRDDSEVEDEVITSKVEDEVITSREEETSKSTETSAQKSSTKKTGIKWLDRVKYEGMDRLVRERVEEALRRVAYRDDLLHIIKDLDNPTYITEMQKMDEYERAALVWFFFTKYKKTQANIFNWQKRAEFMTLASFLSGPKNKEIIRIYNELAEANGRKNLEDEIKRKFDSKSTTLTGGRAEYLLNKLQDTPSMQYEFALAAGVYDSKMETDSTLIRIATEMEFIEVQELLQDKAIQSAIGENLRTLLFNISRWKSFQKARVGEDGSEEEQARSKKAQRDLFEAMTGFKIDLTLSDSEDINTMVSDLKLKVQSSLESINSRLSEVKTGTWEHSFLSSMKDLLTQGTESATGITKLISDYEVLDESQKNEEAQRQLKESLQLHLKTVDQLYSNSLWKGVLSSFEIDVNTTKYKKIEWQLAQERNSQWIEETMADIALTQMTRYFVGKRWAFGFRFLDTDRFEHNFQTLLEQDKSGTINKLLEEGSGSLSLTYLKRYAGQTTTKGFDQNTLQYLRMLANSSSDTDEDMKSLFQFYARVYKHRSSYGITRWFSRNIGGDPITKDFVSHIKQMKDPQLALMKRARKKNDITEDEYNAFVERGELPEDVFNRAFRRIEAQLIHLGQSRKKIKDIFRLGSGPTELYQQMRRRGIHLGRWYRWEGKQTRYGRRTLDMIYQMASTDTRELALLRNDKDTLQALHDQLLTGKLRLHHQKQWQQILNILGIENFEQHMAGLQSLGGRVLTKKQVDDMHLDLQAHLKSPKFHAALIKSRQTLIMGDDIAIWNLAFRAQRASEASAYEKARTAHPGMTNDELRQTVEYKAEIMRYRLELKGNILEGKGPKKAIKKLTTTDAQEMDSSEITLREVMANSKGKLLGFIPSKGKTNSEDILKSIQEISDVQVILKELTNYNELTTLLKQRNMRGADTDKIDRQIAAFKLNLNEAVVTSLIGILHTNDRVKVMGEILNHLANVMESSREMKNHLTDLLDYNDLQYKFLTQNVKMSALILNERRLEEGLQHSSLNNRRMVRQLFRNRIIEKQRKIAFELEELNKLEGEEKESAITSLKAQMNALESDLDSLRRAQQRFEEKVNFIAKLVVFIVSTIISLISLAVSIGLTLAGVSAPAAFITLAIVTAIVKLLVLIVIKHIFMKLSSSSSQLWTEAILTFLTSIAGTATGWGLFAATGISLVKTIASSAFTVLNMALTYYFLPNFNPEADLGDQDKLQSKDYFIFSEIPRELADAVDGIFDSIFMYNMFSDRHDERVKKAFENLGHLINRDIVSFDNFNKAIQELVDAANGSYEEAKASGLEEDQLRELEEKRDEILQFASDFKLVLKKIKEFKEQAIALEEELLGYSESKQRERRESISSRRNSVSSVRSEIGSRRSEDEVSTREQRLSESRRESREIITSIQIREELNRALREDLRAGRERMERFYSRVIEESERRSSERTEAIKTVVGGKTKSGPIGGGDDGYITKKEKGGYIFHEDGFRKRDVEVLAEGDLENVLKKKKQKESLARVKTSLLEKLRNLNRIRNADIGALEPNEVKIKRQLEKIGLNEDINIEYVEDLLQNGLIAVKPIRNHKGKYILAGGFQVEDSGKMLIDEGFLNALLEDDTNLEIVLYHEILESLTRVGTHSDLVALQDMDYTASVNLELTHFIRSFNLARLLNADSEIDNSSAELKLRQEVYQYLKGERTAESTESFLNKLLTQDLNIDIIRAIVEAIDRSNREGTPKLEVEEKLVAFIYNALPKEEAKRREKEIRTFMPRSQKILSRYNLSDFENEELRSALRAELTKTSTTVEAQALSNQSKLLIQLLAHRLFEEKEVGGRVGISDEIAEALAKDLNLSTGKTVVMTAKIAAILKNPQLDLDEDRDLDEIYGEEKSRSKALAKILIEQEKKIHALRTLSEEEDGTELQLSSSFKVVNRESTLSIVHTVSGRETTYTEEEFQRAFKVNIEQYIALRSNLDQEAETLSKVVELRKLTASVEVTEQLKQDERRVVFNVGETTSDEQVKEIVSFLKRAHSVGNKTSFKLAGDTEAFRIKAEALGLYNESVFERAQLEEFYLGEVLIQTFAEGKPLLVVGPTASLGAHSGLAKTLLLDNTNSMQTSMLGVWSFVTKNKRYLEQVVEKTTGSDRKEVENFIQYIEDKALAGLSRAKQFALPKLVPILETILSELSDEEDTIMIAG